MYRSQENVTFRILMLGKGWCKIVIFLYSIKYLLKIKVKRRKTPIPVNKW